MIMSELTPINNIVAREFSQMEWLNPEKCLIELRNIEENLPVQLDEKIRRLRTNPLKKWREARIAALFSYGMSRAVLKLPVLFSRSEEKDFDFVMRWQVEDKDFFYPVQLKELPPDDINSAVTLDDIYTKLEKYSGATDLSVLIHINRRMRFDFNQWTRDRRPNIKELWHLGCESAEQSRFFLYGDTLKRNPRKYEFAYPI
jgi:hypothetical protein